MTFNLSLYLVIGSDMTLQRDINWIVKEAIDGGVTMVQLREKDCCTKEFLSTAISLKKRLSPFHIPLIINDRLDIAIAADADGLHIGQDDMPYQIARDVLGYNKIIGLSVENIQQVKDANHLDVDYIGLSPIFDTSTKKDIAKPFEIEGLKEAVKLSNHPIVAIGGVNQQNVSEIIREGADGVAVVSAISHSPNPKESSIELIRLINKEKLYGTERV